jgi:hypothetical protein
MSRILWKQAKRAVPGKASQSHVYGIYDNYDFRIPRAVSWPIADEDIVDLPEPRVFRALNRSGLLLAAVGLQSRNALAGFLAKDPFSVGLYCAMQDGPDDYNCGKQMVHVGPEDFARKYKFLRSSKQFLREGGFLQGSVLGMFLGIMGPLYSFTHSRWACLQALEQAEFDLKNGAVRAALVGSGFSLEDPLLSMRIRRSIPERSILCEGAAAVLLASNGQHTDWRSAIPTDDRCFYGTAHDLVLLAERPEENDGNKEMAGRVHGNRNGELQSLVS